MGARVHTTGSPTTPVNLESPDDKRQGCDFRQISNHAAFTMGGGSSRYEFTCICPSPNRQALSAGPIWQIKSLRNIMTSNEGDGFASLQSVTILTECKPLLLESFRPPLQIPQTSRLMSEETLSVPWQWSPSLLD